MIGIRLGHGEVKTPGYGFADELVRKAPEQESTEGRFVHNSCTMRKAIEYGSRWRMGPPLPVVWETTEYGSDDEGWFRLGAVVRKTQAYGSAVGGLRKAPAGGVRKVSEHEATE
ncbi:hypothetical protein Y032_0549g3292 [Ancylostoma ceylanicum]|uniref:Uncharacterized protein n=1 Tax=Ancylostoma ceylanicum TaxID=53326 RepID=A0A016WRS1_9BILA|nr:hypothetical protein Y032_0549g3292 [Ancylostoma ceylanicum]